jgi:hypothetical protein
MMKLSPLARGAGAALVLLLSFLLSVRSAFAAAPAPKPTAADVEAWGRLVDAAFSSEQLTGIALAKTLAVTGAAALREGKPALGEACLKRAYAAAPQYRVEEGNTYLSVAMELSRDAGRRVSLAPFLLLYLDVAEAKGATGLASQAGAVKSLRADLATVKSPPPARENPSVEGLRAVAAASEKWAREELERAKRRQTGGAEVASHAAASRPALDAASVTALDAHRTTMASMRSIATAMEGYEVDKDVFPAGWIEMIEKLLVPTYITHFPRLDAWGTPFRISTGPRMKHYRIVSAGADRVFEPLPYLDPEARPALRKVTDPARDVVFEDGSFLQQFDPARPATIAKSRVLPAPEPAAAEADAARDVHGRALAEIRKVGDAIAQYRSDFGRFPDIGSRLVEGSIPGVYIAKVPTHDPWGTEYRVGWSADRKHFRIVSAGADRVFEPLGAVDPWAAWGPSSLATDPKRDIVFQDGVFLQAYRDER